MPDIKRAVELGVILGWHYPRASPVGIARVVESMVRAARAARNWETRRCNEPMTEAQAARGNRRIARMESNLNAILATRGLRLGDELESVAVDKPAAVKLGGDPRGPCAALMVPGLKGDGWGDGFAIY